MAQPSKYDALLADRNSKPMIGTQGAAVTAVAAIAGGEAPTEAEHNLAVAAINSLISRLEAHGLIADN